MVRLLWQGGFSCLEGISFRGFRFRYVFSWAERIENAFGFPPFCCVVLWNVNGHFECDINGDE